MDLFVGKMVQHEVMGEGRVEEVWPDITGKSLWAQVQFNGGNCVTCNERELKGVNNGNG